MLRTILVVGLLLLVSSCSTVPPSVAESVDAQPANSAASEVGDLVENVAADEAVEPAEIEYGTFTEDVLSRSIIAELAGQRGYSQQSLNEYLELARETNDINIIKRTLRIAAFLRNVSVAIEMGNKWLEQEPDSTEAHRTLALQMIALGRYRESLNHLVPLLERGNNVDFRLITSRTATDANAALFLDALIAEFHELMERFPEHETLRLSLAHLYQQNEQIEEAYQLVSELAADMNDSPEIVILEIQLLELLGEDRQASRRLQQSLDNNPQHKQLRFLYGRKLIDEQRYTDAKEQFTLIVEQFPDDFDMLYSLALISMEVNMLSDAREYFNTLVANGQRLQDSHYYLGFINAQENANDAAIEQYLLVSSGSNFLQAQRNLTELMIRAKRYPEVKSHLQNVRFRNVDYNIALLTMEANVLMDENENALAGIVLNSSVGAFPNNLQLLFLRSIWSQNTNDLVLMEQDLRKVILLNPTSPVAYNSLGYTLADRTDRYEEAYTLIKHAIELAPNDPAIIDSLGWVQYRLGLFDEAKENLEQAYELFPDAEVAAHLGEVLWVMGERSAANRVWRNALITQPESEHIQNAMERLTTGNSI